MKVHEIMNKKVITCRPTETVLEILNKLKMFKINGMPVINKNKELVGIICRADLLRFLPNIQELDKINKEDLIKKFKTPIEEVMVKEVVTTNPVDKLEEAVELMVEKNVNVLPVVESKKVVGILSRHDVIKEIIRQ